MDATVVASSVRPRYRPYVAVTGAKQLDQHGGLDIAAHRRRVWGLAYRLTGSAADADDIVQETFARWWQHASRNELQPAWLVRVATNLGIDVVRTRRRRGYPGAWLPGPVADEEDQEPEAMIADERTPEARYGLAESTTVAFLIALEVLGPRQRAVLLLRDVAQYTSAETAEVLGTTEGNVRVLHTRARRVLAAYDRTRCPPTPELRARHETALRAFLAALASKDSVALETLLAESVRTVTDSAGEYAALATPMIGRDRVARFYLQAASNRAAGRPSVAIRVLNGWPAAIITLEQPVRRQAPVTVMAVCLNGDGQIETIRTVMAHRKLAGLRGDAAEASCD